LSVKVGVEQRINLPLTGKISLIKFIGVVCQLKFVLEYAISVVFILPPEDPIRVKQAVEVLVLCFTVTVYAFRSETYLRHRWNKRLNNLDEDISAKIIQIHKTSTGTAKTAPNF